MASGGQSCLPVLPKTQRRKYNPTMPEDTNHPSWQPTGNCFCSTGNYARPLPPYQTQTGIRPASQPENSKYDIFLLRLHGSFV